MPDINDLLMRMMNPDPYAEDRKRLEEQIARMNQPEQPSWFSQTPIGQDLANLFPEGTVPFKPGPGLTALGIEQTPALLETIPQERADAAAGLVEEKRPQPGQAQQIVDAEYERKQESQRLQSEGADQVQALKEAAKQAQIDELSSLVDDMPAQKLFDIRAQASAAGRQGRLGGDLAGQVEPQDALKGFSGGGFSQQEMTPEIQQRLDDNAAWLANAPIRNAEFAMSTEQAEMRPGQAAAAADLLPRLQREATLRQKVENTEKLLTGMVGPSGKIPFESAMKINMSGGDIYVPPQMIGISPDQADREVAQIIEAAGAGMMQKSAFGDSGPASQFEELSLMLGQAAQQQLQAGGDRDVIIPQLRVKIRNLLVSLGIANVNNIASLNEQLGVPEGQ